MSDPPAVVVVVRDDPEQHRFEVVVDGTVAGVTQYRERPAGFAFVHTEVDQAYAGRGLGGILVRGALDAMRYRHTSVLPYCPFVLGYIRRHPAYLDLVPVDERSAFDLTG